MKDGDWARPGDVLAQAEEYEPGNGTFVDGDLIRSSLAGIVNIDKDELRVSVFAQREPARPRKGEVVHGRVTKVNPKVVKVKLLRIEGSERQVAVQLQADLQAKDTDTGGSGMPLFKPMELVRARVVEDMPVIRLSTKGGEMGAIKAYCRTCRSTLALKSGKLHCPSCDRNEDRETAENYGLEF